MIKSIIKETITTLLSKPKLIRLAFLMTFGHTIYRTYLVTYFLNYILRERYESGVELSNALVYIINKIQEFDIRGFIISFVLIILIGNFLLYPIGEASLVYYMQDNAKKLSSSISKGIRKFFVMFEFNGLWFAFGMYTIITIVIRLRMMGILDNIILKILMIIWGIIVTFATFFRPYARYYIVIKNLNVFDALKKSIYLTMNNISLTFKGVIFEMLLFGRFIINTLLVIAVPLTLIYIAIFFNIIEYTRIETIIRISTGIMIILIAYINGIFEAFFTNYRYRIFEEAEKNLNE